METINKYPQLGGNIALFIIPFNKVSAINGMDILCTAPDPVIELDCARESIKYSFVKETTRAGTLYNNKISAFMPGHTQSNQERMHELSSGRFIVVVADADGVYWRIGNKSEPLKLDVEFDSSTDPSARNGYTITLSGVSIYPVQTTNFPVLSS